MVVLYLLLPVASAFTPHHFERMGNVTLFITYGLVLVMLFLGPLAHFRTGSLASLWSLASFLLYIRWFGALSLTPGKYLSVFQTCVGESLAPRNVFNASGGKGISQVKIKTLGVESTLFVHNSGQLLVSLAVTALVLIIVSTLGKGEGESIFHTLRRKWQYSLLLLVAFLSFQDLLIYAFLQLQGLEFSSTASIISVLLAFAFLLLCLVFTLFVPVVICRKLVVLKSTGLIYYSKWRFLVEEMKAGLPLPRYQYYSIYLFQRWIAAILYVFLDNHEIQLGALLALEGCVLAWLLYARPYDRAVDRMGVGLLQAIVCLLLFFECCFLLSWNDRGEMFLAFAYIFTYWFGIVVSLARFGLSLYSQRNLQAPEPQTAMTEVSVVELKSHLPKVADEEDQILSQKPSDPYYKMTSVSPPLREKSPNQVHPITPATPAPSVAPSTQTGMEEAGSWVSRWSRFKAPVH